MNKVLFKINEARKKIKESKLTKAGRNTHSNYDYYTPEQVNHLVTEACNELGLFNSFQLKRTDKGLDAEITVYDLDSDESKVFVFATDIPSITATNVAQQIGGCMTYSERYGLMFIYDIKDNNLDFDTLPVKKQKEPNPEQQTNFETRELTKKEVEDEWNGKIYKDGIVYIKNTKVVPPKEQIDKLKTHPKYKEK